MFEPGQNVFIVVPDAESVPLKAGKYELEDGKILVVKEDGIIVCLYSKNNSLEVENNGIIEYKKKTIGVTNVSYMKWGK